MEGFLAAHQMGVTQLVVSYCNALISDTGRRGSFFPGFNFGAGAGTAFSPTGRDQIIEPLLEKLLAHEIEGSKLDVQADPDELRLELDQLITRLVNGGTGTTPSSTTRPAAASTR